MPPSTLQSKVDAAWDAIRTVVEAAVGTAADRAIHKIGKVHPVPATNRVLVVDVANMTTIADGVEVTEYEPTLLKLKQRRYTVTLTADLLDDIASGNEPATSNLTTWAESVVAKDAFTYVQLLSDPELTIGLSVPDPFLRRR
ncbi:MAG: hypothetical protein M3Q30_05470 [Actinomycetota bacterium]|nr:hypothetical protein [Actinomycetota bacterium]